MQYCVHTECICFCLCRVKSSYLCSGNGLTICLACIRQALTVAHEHTGCNPIARGFSFAIYCHSSTLTSPFPLSCILSCIRVVFAGGRGVIEGLGSQLGLSQRQLEPSASTLYWYGNTSSSSLWYALSYIESRQTVKKGDRVWQVTLSPSLLAS